MSPISLPASYADRLKHNEPMSRHTTWHVGGPAELYFEPRDINDVQQFLLDLPSDTPVTWIGLGSNLLVRDGGLRGAVIATGGLSRLEILDSTTLYGEAGVLCAVLAKQCVKASMGAAEFFAGIPGTLGGALAMNAGAFGGETWNHVIEVETIDRKGQRHTRMREEYTVGYRSVQPPAQDEWYIAAKLRFDHNPEAHNDDIRALLDRRKETQPIGAWSGGSTFTNPPGDHAARLIEATGLKGYRIGGARVSTKHANFFLNDGNATAADLEKLILHVQAAVKQKHGTLLHTEVRIIGNPS